MCDHAVLRGSSASRDALKAQGNVGLTNGKASVLRGQVDEGKRWPKNKKAFCKERTCRSKSVFVLLQLQQDQSSQLKQKLGALACVLMLLSVSSCFSTVDGTRTHAINGCTLVRKPVHFATDVARCLLLLTTDHRGCQRSDSKGAFQKRKGVSVCLLH